MIDADAHTIDLLVDDAELERRRKELEAARAALHERLPRQVRPARPGRRDGRDHQLLTHRPFSARWARRRAERAETEGRGLPEILEAEQARELIEARALGREIATVHAPDAWFLKRGLTPEPW